MNPDQALRCPHCGETVEPLDLYLTPAECARLRRRSTAALSMERRDKAGPPYITDGNRILYPRHALEEWLAARLVIPPGRDRA